MSREESEQNTNAQNELKSNWSKPVRYPIDNWQWRLAALPVVEPRAAGSRLPQRLWLVCWAWRWAARRWGPSGSGWPAGQYFKKKNTRIFKVPRHTKKRATSSHVLQMNNRAHPQVHLSLPRCRPTQKDWLADCGRCRGANGPIASCWRRCGSDACLTDETVAEEILDPATMNFYIRYGNDELLNGAEGCIQLWCRWSEKRSCWKDWTDDWPPKSPVRKEREFFRDF